MLDPRPYWNFDDPAVSEFVFRDLLENTSDVDDRIVVQTQIARALGLQGKFDEAHALLGSLAPVGALDRAWLEIELGRVFNSQTGDARLSVPHFEAATSITKDWPDDENLYLAEHVYIDSLHMMGVIVQMPQSAAVFNYEAIEAALECKTDSGRRWLPSLYNNLGWEEIGADNYEAALAAFEKSLEWARHFGEDRRIFPARYAVAHTHRIAGRSALALEQFSQLQKDLLAAGRSDQYVAAELAILRGEKAD